MSRRPHWRHEGDTTAFRWVLLAFTLAAYGLRVWRLDANPYRGDEAFGVWFVSQDWLSLIAATARNEPHPPLFYLLTKLMHDTLGDTEYIFRWFPVFFGVLAVPVLGKLGRILSGDRPQGLLVASGAAALLAINPFHIWNAQDARMYTQSVALSLWSLLAFCQLDAEPTSRRRSVTYGIISALAALSHYAFLPLLAGQNLVFFARHWRERRALLGWIVVQALLAALVLGWMAANLQLLVHYVGNGDSPGLLNALQRTGTAFLTGRSGSPEWAGVVGVAGLIVATLGVWWLIRASGLLGALAVLTVFAGFASQWAASLRAPVFNETYLLPSSGVYYLLVAAGAAMIARLYRPLGYTSLICILIASGLSVNNYFTDPAYAKGADWRSEARAIEREARPGDVIVLNYPDPTFQYYYKGEPAVHLIPATVPVDKAEVERKLADLVANNERIWLVPVRADNWDKDGLVETYLNDHAVPVESQAFRQVRLVLFDTPKTVLAAAHPMSETLGDIQLRGLSIFGPEGGCGRPCDLRVQLIWSANARPAADYKVFIHIVDTAGAIVAQSDGVPADWRRPTSGWAPGELIVDEHDLHIDAPAGDYTIRAGLYRENGPRLTGPDSRDFIALGSVSVHS